MGKLIPELLEDAARREANRPALKVNRGDGTLDFLTYKELLDKVMKLSSFLQNKGYKMGQHIALLGKNSMEWAISYFAIQMVGCIVVPIDRMLTAVEMRHIIRHSDAVAIFHEQRYGDNFIENDKSLLDVKHYNLEKIDDYIKNIETPLPPRLPKSDEETAVIIYTSGTTGSPKGVMLSHRNIVGDIESIVPVYDFTPDDTFLSVLPVHHSFEATGGFLTPISIGCGICYARALRAKEILEDIEASNATIMLGVPLLFEKFYAGINRGVKKKGTFAKTVFSTSMNLSKLIGKATNKNPGSKIMSPFRKKAGFGNMRLMISGGAAIRPKVVEFFNSFGINFVQGYGLSETSPVLTVNPAEKNKFASVGPAVEKVQLKIDYVRGDIGEVLAKGVPVFKCYYKNPEATKAAFTDDGWFKTGDLGRLDEDGYLFIVGRAKNLLVTDGGKNVHPE
ncbi:MAG: AMP-dependent synthetase/ligase, partial [Candidatus Zixiibacteriota bacterium]